jgi:hypothetical protein
MPMAGNACASRYTGLSVVIAMLDAIMLTGNAVDPVTIMELVMVIESILFRPFEIAIAEVAVKNAFIGKAIAEVIAVNAIVELRAIGTI